MFIFLFVILSSLRFRCLPPFSPVVRVMLLFVCVLSSSNPLTTLSLSHQNTPKHPETRPVTPKQTRQHTPSNTPINTHVPQNHAQRHPRTHTATSKHHSKTHPDTQRSTATVKNISESWLSTLKPFQSLWRHNLGRKKFGERSRSRKASPYSPTTFYNIFQGRDIPTHPSATYCVSKGGDDAYTPLQKLKRGFRGAVMED